MTAIAVRLRKLGLQTDAVVGIQLPNTAECVLTILGVLRAGMIAVPLPLLWRRADAAYALNQLGAKAIVTASRIGDVDHCELAMQVAADVFPIRYVCGFGESLADGVVPFDDLMAGDSGEPLPEFDAHRQSGGPRRAGDLGRHARRADCGGAQPHRADRRRRHGAARRQPRAGHPPARLLRHDVVCRAVDGADAVAARPAARCRCITPSAPRRSTCNAASTAATRWPCRRRWRRGLPKRGF